MGVVVVGRADVAAHAAAAAPIERNKMGSTRG